MVIAHEQFAVGVLNPIKLEPGLAEELAPIGHSVVDRREIEKVVVACTRAGEQQHYEPDRLHRLPPIYAPRPHFDGGPAINLSLFESGSKSPMCAAH